MRPRSNSYTTSFPFFNSKLLSTIGDNEGSATTPSPRSNGIVLPEDTQKPILRPAVSSPDIKALFNAPHASQAYSYLPPDSNNGSNSNMNGQSPSYQYQPTYQQKPQSSGLPELNTPRFYSPHSGANTSGHGSRYSISSTFMPNKSTRLSEEMTLPSSTMNSSGNATSSSNKRESDPIMEDRIKDLIRRGALGHHHLNARAQSLDISQQIKTFGRHASPSADSETVSAALSQLRF